MYCHLACHPAFAERRVVAYPPTVAGCLTALLAFWIAVKRQAAKVPLMLPVRRKRLYQTELPAECPAAAERPVGRSPAWRIGLPFEGCFGRAIRGTPAALRLS